MCVYVCVQFWRVVVSLISHQDKVLFWFTLPPTPLPPSVCLTLTHLSMLLAEEVPEVSRNSLIITGRNANTCT